MAFNENNNNYYDNQPFYVPPVEPDYALPPLDSLRDQLRLEQWLLQQQQLCMEQFYYDYNNNNYPHKLGNYDAAPLMLYPELYGIMQERFQYVLYMEQQLKKLKLQEQLMERMMSFLEPVDRKCPFLTPWAWDRNLQPNSDDLSTKLLSGGEPAGNSKEYMKKFQPGSLFSHEVHDQVKQVQEGTADDQSSYDTDDIFLHCDDFLISFPSVNGNPTEDLDSFREYDSSGREKDSHLCQGKSF